MPRRQKRERGEVTLEPALEFLRLLWRIEHCLQSASKRMRTKLGITGPQRLVLRIVGRSPGMSAGQLADIVRLHPSTITGIVQRLVAKGLLVRQFDSTDSRRMRLSVRPRARRLTGRSSGTIEAAVQDLLGRNPRVHVEHARTLLTALADSLERDPAVGASVPRRSRGRMPSALSRG